MSARGEEVAKVQIEGHDDPALVACEGQDLVIWKPVQADVAEVQDVVSAPAEIFGGAA
jgi:hypothetical protein